MARVLGERTTHPASTSWVGRQTTGDLGFGIGNRTVGDVTFVPGPDEANFVLRSPEAAAIAGPIQVTLWLRSTGTNTDVFADLLDVDLETGATTDLQRGLLRGSLRAVEPAESKRITTGTRRGQIYWYWHPYVDPQPLSPGKPVELRFKIYPIGHRFYPGHAMVLSVHAPSPSDPLSTYLWASGQPPALNTILQRPGSLTGEPCFIPLGERNLAAAR